MIDVEDIKGRIDCREVVERDLGQPKSRNNRYLTYKCPLHHEQKGYSLVVYADHWRCFGKCGRGGDAIAWLQEYHHLSFQEACEQLSSGDLRQREPVNRFQNEKTPPLSEPPDAGWQRSARTIAALAMDTLWGREGRRAWRYLGTDRGLTEDTILRAGLGYIPGGCREWKTIAGLHVPCGITIPWFAEGGLWGIKVRRAAGEMRYLQVRGSNIKGCLYLVDDVQPGLPVFLTEGEFDALIISQVGRGMACAVSIGSAANKRINSRWFPRLISAPSILVRMDEDQAGAGAASMIAGLSQAMKRVQVPQGKDVNDFYLLAGRQGVLRWIQAMIGEHIE